MYCIRDEKNMGSGIPQVLRKKSIAIGSVLHSCIMVLGSATASGGVRMLPVLQRTEKSCQPTADDVLCVRSKGRRSDTDNKQTNKQFFH